MKFAVISDIHGNIVALRAALAEIACENTDRLLVLGDLFGPGHVRDIFDELRGRDALIIRGNGEGYQLARHRDGAFNAWTHNAQYAVLREIYAGLTPADLRWMEALPGQISLRYGDFSLRLVHGSPKADNENLLSDDSAVLRCALDMADETVILCGHSHRAMLKRFGERYICNVGSVGLNFDPTYTADLTFITLEGGLSFEHRRVPYDFGTWRQMAGDLPYARLCLRGTELGRDLWVEFLDEARRRGGWPVPNDVWNGLLAEWEGRGLV